MAGRIDHIKQDSAGRGAKHALTGKNVHRRVSGAPRFERSLLKRLRVCSGLSSITTFHASPPFKSRVTGFTMR